MSISFMLNFESKVYVSVADSTLHLSATVNVPLPWTVAGTAVVRFPP